MPGNAQVRTRHSGDGWRSATDEVAYDRTMVSWREFTESAPLFAATVRSGLEAGPYALLGSIRSDGFPRISGVIVTFSDHELWVGMPSDSIKTGDLMREPRMSLHSSVSASPTAQGDVKLHGRAAVVSEDEAEFVRFVTELGRHVRPGTLTVFRIDVHDAAQVRLSEARDRHLIESWRAGQQGTLTRQDHP